jgi:hypothetical protein
MLETREALEVELARIIGELTPELVATLASSEAAGMHLQVKRIVRNAGPTDVLASLDAWFFTYRKRTA